jgi:DNA-binding HxlR family transcriptional regulator
MGDPGARVCSVAAALAVVGERWSLLALREVFYGVRRFDAIARNTGAPRDILSARLKALVEHGVLERVRYNDHPPRYEYRLTGKGRDLRPVLLSLMKWGDRYLLGEPPVVWEHHCGADLDPTLVCRSCGEEVTGRDLSPRFSAPLRS